MAQGRIPPVAFRFRVQFLDKNAGNGQVPLRGGPDAYFQQVSGIGGSFEIERRRRGARNSRTPTQLPKGVNAPDLVLKRGLFFLEKPEKKDVDVLGWVINTFENGHKGLQKKDILITLSNELGNPLIGFKYTQAWVKQWQLSDLNAMESSLAIESLTLAFSKFEIIRDSNQLPSAPS